MSEWTHGAQEYLDGYLHQVGALAQENGDDTREIVEQLRDHVNHEIAAMDTSLVTVDMVRRVLSSLGTPETIVSGDWSPSRPVSEPVRRPASPPPPPHPAPQHVIVEKRGGCSKGCIIAAVIGALLFLSIPVAGIITAIALPAVARSREAARRAACQGNLKQLASILAQYQEKHGTLPPYSARPGELMFDVASMEPELAPEKGMLQCPSRGDSNPDDWPGDDCYIYMPLPKTVPGMLEGFAAAYTEAIKTGAPVEISQLAAPETLKIDPVLATKTPLVVERPGAHLPAGCNVLYLDGHVKFHRADEMPDFIDIFNAIETVDGLDGDSGLEVVEDGPQYIP